MTFSASQTKYLEEPNYLIELTFRRTSRKKVSPALTQQRRLSLKTVRCHHTNVY